MMEYTVTEYKTADKGRVEICLNGDVKLWLYRREAEEFSLAEGLTLSEEQYQYMLHEVIGKRAIKRAMHLLERQERTECQLRQKLLQTAYPPEAVEDAVSYVRKCHYLDDERYARTFIRFHQDKRSKVRLKSDLMQRGVPKDMIERCMEEEFLADEREQIGRLLEKKNFCPDAADRKECRRIYQFLMRRGFKSSDIMAVMDKW